ncbi:MAG: PilX N-terminal domain-containing pilus assembly protein [Candidatus Acidiferrales bacterium]
MRTKCESGVALISTLLVLLLVSALVVGMSWMVMTDQHLGSNSENRETAFYGAEAGMEKLTADLGNIYATQGSITGANLTSAPVTVPPAIPGITYINASGGSTYTVTCNGCPAAPASTSSTILPPSPYAGMQGLITPFTLTVAAQTSMGSEVKLQREIQLVSIPVFQFGIFSQTDLSFFAGPAFDFGGRVHTNGNLWLAANTGPLYLGDKVTVSGQVIRSNLENGYPGGGGVIASGGTYGGGVNVALLPLPIPPNPVRPPYVATQWGALATNQGSVNGPTVYGSVGSAAPNPSWGGIEKGLNDMIETGAPALNLQSTALSGLTTPITLIERPVVGELAANPSQFYERYFDGGAQGQQVSLRILLDDYGPSGTCTDADMTKLDTVTATAPIDLATLGFGAGQKYTTNPGWYTAATKIPLPTSDATTPYSAANGYWIKSGYPIITGCIKIEYENAAGAFTDVTSQILNYGFTGANLYPKNWGSIPPTVPSLPATGTVIAPTACANPSPNAILRLARMRDNPASAAAANGYCGTTTDVTPTDYWPNVLYDTREGVSRDNTLPNDTYDAASNPYITAQGVMFYIELDIGNLEKWFLGTLAGSTGTNASNVGGYEVYFSDRRGNQIDPSSGTKTGAFGFDDIINGTSSPANGCPNNTLDPGEDFAGDGVFRTYGGRPVSAGQVSADSPYTLGYAAGPTITSPFITTVSAPNLIPNLLQNSNCGLPLSPVGAPPGPNYMYKYTQEARENPPIFFRRALKIVDAQTINLGTACYGAAPPNPPCGLTIASENPAYIQGEYNDGGVNNSNFTGASVASSVAADSVTLLSDNWNDVNTFISPYDPTSRPAVTTTYRVAIIAGKGVPFPEPAGGVQDYGTDGGLHNFLRFDENWGGQNLDYRGSLVSFFYSVAGIGPYKCCTTVYDAPGRVYSFDENFTLGPQWLPPRSPTLRSINTVGFSQELLPTQ